MQAYTVSYRRNDEPLSTNLVWAESYGQVEREFEHCSWFAASVAPEWKVRECRDKGMPERWLS